MRFSPTRIVLAVLACIVGAVLALPMLLARKADAHDALPLTADVTGRTVIANAQRIAAVGELQSDAKETDSAAAQDTSCADVEPVALPPAADAFEALTERAVPAGPAQHDPGLAALAYDPADALRAGPWPEPLILIERRRYHLRP